MSSDMIQTSGCRRSTAAIAPRSSAEHAAPEGLFGLFRISHLDRGVIAASISSARGLKPLFCGHGTNTGTPSSRVVISG